MSIHIPEGYEIQYAIRQPDGELFKIGDTPAFWLDQSQVEQYLEFLRRRTSGIGIEYLGTINGRLCSPFFDLNAPVQDFVEEIERWRKSQGGQA